MFGELMKLLVPDGLLGVAFGRGMNGMQRLGDRMPPPFGNDVAGKGLPRAAAEVRVAGGRGGIVNEDRRPVRGRRLREVAAQLRLGRHGARDREGNVLVEPLVAAHEERPVRLIGPLTVASPL